MYNTYTIGELAKILGITPETIRYYERKGIIAPIHDEKTNYRYYTTWDLHMIIRARCYLGFGLTIDETSKILQKRTLEEIDDVLDNQEKIIEQNIIYNMNLLKKMRTNRALINNFEEKNLTLRTSPGIFRIDTQKCYTLDLSEQEKEELKQFTQYVPFIFSTALFPKEHIETENKDFYFGVGIEEGLIMWVGALPCILLVVLLNKNYIVSVVITFFYTTANYILSMSDAFLTQPFGLNIGTLFPGPLAFRWTFQFYDQSQTSAELADLLERISPYFLNGVQVFGVIVVEAVVFLALIALVYRRQEI